MANVSILVNVNKAALESPLSLPAATLITINMLYCIKRAFKLVARPLALSVAATATPPPPPLPTHVSGNEWEEKETETGYQVCVLISPTYDKAFQALFGPEICPWKRFWYKKPFAFAKQVNLTLLQISSFFGNKLAPSSSSITYIYILSGQTFHTI